MSNNKNNLPLTIDGNPNYKNDVVLASIIDTVGLNLTHTLNNMANNPSDDGVSFILSETDAAILIKIQNLLQAFRYSIPVDATVEEAMSTTRQILIEMDEHKNAMRNQVAQDADMLRAAGKAFGLENEVDEYLASFGVKPSVSDAADDILRDLRETGTIGGSRAV